MTNQSCGRGATLLLALLALAGCENAAWLEKLPPEHRMAGPALDGVWLLGGDEVLGLQGEPAGKSGCAWLKATSLDAADARHSELLACYHDVGGSLLLELQDTGFFPTYQHALIEPDGESLRLCWTYGWVDSARAAGLIDLPVLVRGSDTLITASGAEMFAIYQGHLADLRRHCQEEPDGWIAFRRLSPAPGREGLPFD